MSSVTVQPPSPDPELENRLWASLEKTIQGVLRAPDIAAELKAARLRPWDVSSDILNEPFFLSRARGKYKTVVDRAEKIREHEKRKPPWWPSDPWRPSLKQALALALAGLLPLTIAIVIFVDLLSMPAIVTILVLIVMYRLEPSTRALLRYGLPMETWQRLQWGRQRRVLKLGLPFLRYDWKQTIREELVLPEVREKINQKKNPVFDHTLAIRDASGLRSADDLSFVIETRTTTTLLRELTRLRSGAIALAGPRGVGKSTLIRAMAANMFPLLYRRPQMTVTATAPARYEPRVSFCISTPLCVERCSTD